MKLASTECIFKALDEAGVIYLVAGGLAVNVHGYVRYTKDLDFVLQLSTGNIKKAAGFLRRHHRYRDLPVKFPTSLWLLLYKNQL